VRSISQMEQLMNARMNLRNAVETAESSMLEKLWAEQQQLRSEVEAIHRCLRKGGLLSDGDMNLETCESLSTMSQSEGVPADESLQDMMHPTYVIADTSEQNGMCQADNVSADVSPQDKKCQSECAPAHESLRALLAARAVAVCLTTSTTAQSVCALRQVSQSVRYGIDASQEQRLCVIGGVDQSWFRCSQEIVKAESLDAQSGAWEPLSTSTPLRVRHFNHAGAVLCGCIFICGGGFAPFNAVKCFNLQHKNWKKMRPMHASRNFPAAAAIGQQLYVCGGWDGKMSVSSSSERFSPLRGEDGTGEWEYLPDMSLKRHTHAAVALRGQFFVCGGAQANMESLARSDVTKSAEAFSPLTGKWEQLPSMKEQRFFHAAAALGGIAYVLGGAGGKDGAPFFTPDTSVECYDPSTNLWSHSAPMLFQRQAHAATVVAGRLYVCGGYMEPTPHMAHVHAGHSVECFDPETGTWEAAEPMQEGRAQFSIGVVSQLDQAARF